MVHRAKPISGPGRTVWEAWEEQTGRPPFTVECLNPNRNQQARGVPRYVVNGKFYADCVADAKAGRWERD